MITATLSSTRTVQRLKMVQLVPLQVCQDGMFIFDDKIHLSPRNSVYQAELTAINEAVKWFLKSSDARVLELKTDSLSSIHALKNIFPSNVIVQEIFNQLLSNPDRLINFVWVKAHAGDPGNERADQLAKEATSQANSNRSITVLYPRSVFNNYCRSQIHDSWQRSWTTSDKGRDTYNILHRVNSDFICGGRLISYFLSGHGSFPVYLKKIGRMQTDNCDCGQKGSVAHYLFGKCQFIQQNFTFDKRKTLRENFASVLFGKKNYNRLCNIYNTLNDMYSFIKYKF